MKYYEASCPPLLEGIYFWWLEINQQRTFREVVIDPMAGNVKLVPNAITFTELKAWSELMGINPSPFEVGVMLDIDKIYRRIHSE